MQYEIEEKGRFTMIHIIGNLNHELSTRILDDAISERIKEGYHHYVFNLERTTFLDSTGISIFIHCLCDVQDNNGSIFIIAEDTQVREVLHMVGIDRLVKVYENEDDFLDDQQVLVQ
jgi:anti-anti-sigma factor